MFFKSEVLLSLFLCMYITLWKVIIKMKANQIIQIMDDRQLAHFIIILILKIIYVKQPIRLNIEQSRRNLTLFFVLL